MTDSSKYHYIPSSNELEDIQTRTEGSLQTVASIVFHYGISHVIPKSENTPMYRHLYMSGYLTGVISYIAYAEKYFAMGITDPEKIIDLMLMSQFKTEDNETS